MIPAAFDYQKVRTVEEAIAALAGGGKILAGGHSLIPAMKLRLNRPPKLVDIAGISDLKGIKEEDREIVIGATATHAEIANDKHIKDNFPFFAEGTALIGDMQVRNHGTIGGSIAHADPAADWPALVLAADAVIEVQGSKGKRRIKSTDFFTGLFSTALEDDEIITAIRIPVPSNGAKTTYQKFAQPASRFAIVGCAVMRFADGKTNIAFTGVSENVFRAGRAEKVVSGNPLNDASIAAAVGAALQGVSILSDHYASEEYRSHLAKVYLKKALLAVG
ncbi:xanthine dehydrogenase family protein subunit M [Pseudoflavitalea sp. X16]|uniref:FAD binding domain-containing protein n=1 Tax=Paraflavitalea devenefica TaxID=2716334 RepID=UPI0014227FD8|nr:xanthine dehydrogenase family protein subunit M [Paraflavitalea devenefica]NII28167.1 xanthine dehydrogenase family protein subunit M [Paraflavitalea devenefica]